MFLPVPRVRGTWVALVLVALTPLSAIAVSPVKKFPKSCVWRVINAEAPFYLVGSIHALDKNDYPLPSPYEVALRNSTRFVFEFDPNRAPEFERKFEAAAKYPPGQDIRSKIDPALLRWLRQKIFTLKTILAKVNGHELQASTVSFVTNHGGLRNTFPPRLATARVPLRTAWTITSWSTRNSHEKR